MSEVKDIIEGLKDMTEKLSAWEQDFLQNIDERLSSGIGLTDKQIGKINQIWDKNNK